MADDPDSFAYWLDVTMRARGLSQAALARAVGVADTQVSRWRRGQVVPTLRYLQQIADTFGVPRATLDRLAGYPVEVPEEADGDPGDPAAAAELEAHLARLRRLLEERVPRPAWRAYAAACESLAEVLATSFGSPLLETTAGDPPAPDPASGEGHRREEHNMGFRRRESGGEGGA